MTDDGQGPLADHVEVAIVGGGTAGCSAALHLARQGRSTILFEQGLCGSQASGSNYGGVRQQGRCEEELPLSFRARRMWERLSEVVGHDCGFRPTGHIKLARSEEDLATLEDWAAMAKGHGLDVTLIGREALHAAHPYLGESAYGGSWCRSDGEANPRLVAPLFARAAEAAGADVRERCKVIALARENGGFRLGLADGRSVRADVVLNTAGAWGAWLAGQVGDAFDEGILCPHMMVTEPLPPTLTANFGVCGGDIYFRQTGRGNIVFGGGRGTCDKDRLWSRPLAEVGLQDARRISDLIPRVAAASVIRSWSGIDGSMPDHRPVLGASAEVPCLFHAFGFSGHGFQLGPAVGAVLCDLVLVGRTETDISGLSPRRFARARDAT
jgi:sarcosine oxidase subunit beta